MTPCEYNRLRELHENMVDWICEHIKDDEDLFHAFILGMDSFALGLIKAAKLMEDGRLEENLKRRYASFSEGIGKTILDGTADLASLAAYAQEKGNAAGVESGRQEALQSVVNSILFG